MGTSTEVSFPDNQSLPCQGYPSDTRNGRPEAIRIGASVQVSFPDNQSLPSQGYLSDTRNGDFRGLTLFSPSRTSRG